ncbi:MAG: hypothetical protein ABIS18_10935 [Actinomycetota bacterium]
MNAAEIFERYVAAEYAYFTPKGEPLCWPVTPYWYPNTQSLAIATGLAYPKKADYAKLNPKVALLFSDATSSGLPSGDHVSVKADASVKDTDIQANTDRYVLELRQKFPMARLAINRLTVGLLDFYLPRLWIDMVPVDISSIAASASDTPSKPFMGYLDGVVTVKGADGYPAMLRTSVEETDHGTILLGDSPGDGPACLTLHRHTLGGTRFQAHMVRGNITEANRFVPYKVVGFFGNGFVFPLSVIGHIGELRRKLKRELDRRGQPMPKLRIL